MSTETRRWKFRRVAALVFVAIAALMVLLGLTLFSRSLQGSAYLLYWLLCAVTIVLAMIFAFWDLQSIRRELRQEQRELLSEAFKTIESEVRNNRSKAKQ